jgi:hypothetical protein
MKLVSSCVLFRRAPKECGFLKCFMHTAVSGEQFRIYFLGNEIRDSVVGIATGYGLDDRGVGVRAPIESRIFSYPRRPDWVWGPPNFLSNGYRGKAVGA